MNRQSHPLTNEEYKDDLVRAGLLDSFLMPFLLECVVGVPMPVILISAAEAGE
ncbi:MAG: hypothetical protein GY875_00970 [Gammaproteobacteria bacterium]|nr:hypothetical protein [Gammaproteobacteria bacterium]